MDDIAAPPIVPQANGGGRHCSCPSRSNGIMESKVQKKQQDPASVSSKEALLRHAPITLILTDATGSRAMCQARAIEPQEVAGPELDGDLFQESIAS